MERIHPRGQSLLEARGNVIFPKALDEATLLPLVRDADAIVTRALARITRRLMEAAPQLRVVGRHGIGVDNIDVEAATDLGIWVVNTPDAPTEPCSGITGRRSLLRKSISLSTTIGRTPE